MGKGGSVTVGYRYYFGIHMGIGRGPIDTLVEIRVGDKTAWPIDTREIVGYDPWGNPVTTTVPAPPPVEENTTIQIKAGDLFGGDSGEGGIDGPMDVMMGGPEQGINSRLAKMLGGLVPAFRGVTTFFFDGLVCSLNPYPKAWKFRVRRALKGWDGPVWYPEKAKIVLCGDIHAMNPAHMIYECATNRDWGRGLSRDLIDDDSFTSAANTLANECFGLCMKWSRSDDIQSFVQSILDHIGGALYVSRRTGKLTLRLIRQDYILDDLPTFTPNSGLIDVQDDAGSTSDTLYNEILITWHDPINDEDRQVRVQNIAAMQTMGSVSSKTVQYPGLPTSDLALRVGQRDLRTNGMPLRRVKVTLDRRGWKIEPGMPFVISDPARGIESLVLRAGSIEDSTNDTSNIVVTGVQDVFGMPATAWVEPQPPTSSFPSKQPVPVQIHRMIEVPYRELARVLSKADLNNVAPDAGAIALLGVRPMAMSTNFMNYTAATGEAYQTRGAGDYAGTGLTPALDPDTTDFILSSTADMQTAQVGAFALIDDECVRIDQLDVDTGAIKIARGVMDTIPQKHSEGARIWFCQDHNGQDNREYAQGETVLGKELTKTSEAVLAPELAEVDTITIVARHSRPYPPGNVKIGGTPFYKPISIKGDVPITWAHRDRITQADQLVAHDAADIGPEAGTTYNIRLYDSTDTLITQQTGITDNHYTFVEADVPQGSGATIRVELESVRDGLTSYQKYNFTFKHWLSTDAGWGADYGNQWGN